VLRLRRDAHLCVRLGEHHADGLVTLPAESVRQLGVSLHDIANQLEANPFNTRSWS
jgi:hypothetical protein